MGGSGVYLCVSVLKLVLVSPCGLGVGRRGGVTICLLFSG